MRSTGHFIQLGCLLLVLTAASSPPDKIRVATFEDVQQKRFPKEWGVKEGMGFRPL
jgi:hypothetical protein